MNVYICNKCGSIGKLGSKHHSSGIIVFRCKNNDCKVEYEVMQTELTVNQFRVVMDMAENKNKNLYTVDEVAKIFNVTPMAIRYLIYRKRIPYMRIEGHVKFSETHISEVKFYLEHFARKDVKSRLKGGDNNGEANGS